MTGNDLRSPAWRQAPGPRQGLEYVLVGNGSIDGLIGSCRSVWCLPVLPLPRVGACRRGAFGRCEQTLNRSIKHPLVVSPVREALSMIMQPGTMRLTLFVQANFRVLAVPHTPWMTERAFVRRVDTLDSRGAGVSTAQAIDNTCENMVRGRFGHFGHLASLACVGAHVQAHGYACARAGRCPKCPMCPLRGICIYISMGSVVDTSLGWVSKVSTAIKYARKSGGSRVVVSAGSTASGSGPDWGGCRACVAVSARSDGGKGIAGQGGTGTIRAVSALKTGLVEAGLVEGSAKWARNQWVRSGCILVGSTRNAEKEAGTPVSATCPPALAGGGTPRSDPPRPNVSRISVLAALSGRSGPREKIRNTRDRGMGLGGAALCRLMSGAGLGACAETPVVVHGARGRVGSLMSGSQA